MNQGFAVLVLGAAQNEYTVTNGRNGTFETVEFRQLCLHSLTIKKGSFPQHVLQSKSYHYSLEGQSCRRQWDFCIRPIQ